MILICSVGSNDVRIVGGVNAIQGQAPYQCSMQLNGRHFCGCSILNANWILTAGHCVAGCDKHSYFAFNSR